MDGNGFFSKLLFSEKEIDREGLLLKFLISQGLDVQRSIEQKQDECMG